MHFKFSFLSLTTMYICMGFCAFIPLCIQNGVQHIVSINYASHKNWEILNHYFLKYFLLFFIYWLIFDRERERRDIFCFFTYLYIHWLLLVFLYVTWLEIEPTILAYQDDALTNWATWPRPSNIFSASFSFCTSLGFQLYTSKTIWSYLTGLRDYSLSSNFFFSPFLTLDNF